MDYEREKKMFIERLDNMVGNRQLARIASEAGITPTTIRKYRHGTEPGIFKVLAMEEAAGKPRGWLIGAGADAAASNACEIPLFNAFATLLSVEPDGTTPNLFPGEATHAIKVGDQLPMAGVIQPGSIIYLREFDGDLSEEKMLVFSVASATGQGREAGKIGYVSTSIDGEKLAIRFARSDFPAVSLPPEKVNLLYSVLGASQRFL